MTKFEFDSQKLTIRRFKQPAEGDKPATDRMTFSFSDSLGNEVFVRAPNGAVDAELDRYVDERVAKRVEGLTAPATEFLTSVRTATTAVLAEVDALKASFPAVLEAVETQLDTKVAGFKAAQKAARTSINDASSKFAAAVKTTMSKAPEPVVVVATVG